MPDFWQKTMLLERLPAKVKRFWIFLDLGQAFLDLFGSGSSVFGSFGSFFNGCEIK
jgi:hypothetical protein